MLEASGNLCQATPEAPAENWEEGERRQLQEAAMPPSLISTGRDLLGFVRPKQEHLEAFGCPRRKAFGSAGKLALYVKETLNCSQGI